MTGNTVERDAQAAAYDGIATNLKSEPCAYKRQCFRDGWDAARAAMPQQEVTVKDAAKVLLPLAEKRQLPFYIIDMPLTASGDGPTTVGVDATSVCFQVWQADNFDVVAQHSLLSDAVPAWLRAISEGE